MARRTLTASQQIPRVYLCRAYEFNKVMWFGLGSLVAYGACGAMLACIVSNMKKWASIGIPKELAERIQNIAPRLPYHVIIARILDVYERIELNSEFEKGCLKCGEYRRQLCYNNPEFKEKCFQRYIEWRKKDVMLEKEKPVNHKRFISLPV